MLSAPMERTAYFYYTLSLSWGKWTELTIYRTILLGED